MWGLIGLDNDLSKNRYYLSGFPVRFTDSSSWCKKYVGDTAVGTKIKPDSFQALVPLLPLLSPSHSLYPGPVLTENRKGPGGPGGRGGRDEEPAL